VLQGRFTAILVEREAYLLELARYVPLNPVRAGFTNAAENWPWSSYRATAGMEPSPPWLTTSAVLQRFGVEGDRATRRFQEFVREGMKADAPWTALRGQVFLGTAQFVERMSRVLTPPDVSREIPRADRLAARPALASLLPAAILSDRNLRNAAIIEAHRVHGYSLAEIARHLGLHYSTVSRIANAVDAPIQDLTPA
jgi:putative transposase